MRTDSAAVWRRFREEVETQGGRVIEPLWLGSHSRHRVVCSVGHEAAPRPSDVIHNGVRICRACSGCDPAASEQAFRERLAELGSELLEPYKSSRAPVLVRCANGHETRRPPASVREGSDCIVCAGKDQDAAWELFKRTVTERGGLVLESASLGTNKPHRVICPKGHETQAIPTSVRNGLGMCHLCGLTSTTRAEGEFRALVEKLGGTVTEPDWLGNTKPHRVVCSLGHETSPRPADARLTESICRVCAGRDSETAWREFRTRVTEQGGTVVEPEWLGNKKRHRVICKQGHATTAQPNNVDQGGGLCRFCKCKIWDIFYIVANDAEQVVKFGITSHDPRNRLKFHKKNGFGTVLKAITNLPDAADLERVILAALRDAKVSPVRGREYYDIAALPVILDISDNWPQEAVAA